MDIIFVTTAKTDEEAKELLKLLGMPFKTNYRKLLKRDIRKEKANG